MKKLYFIIAILLLSAIQLKSMTWIDFLPIDKNSDKFIEQLKDSISDMNLPDVKFIQTTEDRATKLKHGDWLITFRTATLRNGYTSCYGDLYYCFQVGNDLCKITYRDFVTLDSEANLYLQVHNLINWLDFVIERCKHAEFN
jgi:hypothetical protein